MIIYNVIKYSVYNNGSAEIQKVLSFKDSNKAKEYINNIIKKRDDLIDYAEGEFVIYAYYGETVFIDLVESKVK